MKFWVLTLVCLLTLALYAQSKTISVHVDASTTALDVSAVVGDLMNIYVEIKNTLGYVVFAGEELLSEVNSLLSGLLGTNVLNLL